MGLARVMPKDQGRSIPMAIRTSAHRPAILPVRFPDGKVIDAGQPQPHQAVLVEFPVLIVVRAVPIPRVIVPLIREAYCNPMSPESPKLLDQPVVQLFVPLARKKGGDLLPSIDELRAVPPARIRRIGQGDLLRIAGIPSIFRQTCFLGG